MELKYKVYDKTTDTMYSSDEIKQIDFNVEMVGVGKRNGTTWLDCEDEIEAIILPYTGIKDINKKESYLGDIIKRKEPQYGKLSDNEKTSFGIVKKEKNSNNLYVEWNYKGKYENKTYWGNNKQSLCIIEENEIVGNIYENTDMIKKEG